MSAIVRAHDGYPYDEHDGPDEPAAGAAPVDGVHLLTHGQSIEVDHMFAVLATLHI